jgi:hypothetical protein
MRLTQSTQNSATSRSSTPKNGDFQHFHDFPKLLKIKMVLVVIGES